MISIDDNIVNKIKYYIKKGKTLEEIYLALNITRSEFTNLLSSLEENGQSFIIDDGRVFEQKDILLPDYYKIITEYPIKVCFLSDLHLTSIYDRKDLLIDIYQKCKEKGVSIIFCGGDVTNGYYPERDNYEQEQRIIGYEKTIEYVLNSIPFQKGITMYTIAGNHDYTFYENYGKNIIEEISSFRNDIVFLGDLEREILLNDLKVRIHHGLSKNIRDIPKRLEDYYHRKIECLPDNIRQDIVQLGHIHRGGYKQINNTHFFQTGALLNQSSRYANMGFNLDISCFFAELSFDEEGQLIVKPEKIEYEDSRVLRR